MSLMYPLRAAGAAAAVFICAALIGLPNASHAHTPEVHKSIERTNKHNAKAVMFDARVNANSVVQQSLAAREINLANITSNNAQRKSARSMAQAIALRNEPGLNIKRSSVGAISSVSRKNGALTPAARGSSSEQIVRTYLRGPAGAAQGLDSSDVDDLTVLGDSAGNTSSGLRMLRMAQTINGIPVFQSETRFLIDRDGRLMKQVGALIPGAREQAEQNAGTQLRQRSLSAAEASAALVATLDQTIDAGVFTETVQNDGRVDLDAAAGSNEFIAGTVHAREVLFPIVPGVLVSAWSVVMFTTADEDWYAIVDKLTGDVLWRKNIRNKASAHDARFRVYVQADGVTPADSPAPMSPTTAAHGSNTQPPEIAPTIVSMHSAMNSIASPNGWIDDCPGGGCTSNETQTLGNNVLACLDRTGGANANICDTDANSVLDGNGRPTGNPDANARNRDFLGTTPRDFQTGYLPAPQGGNPEAGQTATGTGAALDQFRRGALTQMFYVSNWFHDQTYALGFDEASGNFQQTNFSGQGLGNDRVLADLQDSSGTNNANFSTPPDGMSGRMQMFRFTGPTIDRDSALDSEILIHELAHGLSNRLVGNGAGLNWDPAGGLGEGWSDFYALALLNGTNADDPNGSYASGAYATYKLSGLLDNYRYGIRRYPYSTDMSINPLTWRDVDDVKSTLATNSAPTSPINFSGAGGMEVHNSGEIWTMTLWEMRANIIADPAGANGDVPTGNWTALQLVTDALKMTPIDPSFTDARDALLEADCATNACANERSIWAAFAKRGLGWGAETPYNVSFGYTSSHTGIIDSIAEPHLDVLNPLTDVSIDDNAPGNSVNGALDPGEAVRLTVTLHNPWRSTGLAATGISSTLSSSTAGVTIHSAQANFATITAQGSGASSTPYIISLSPTLTAGAALDFTLTTTSSLGSSSTTFRLRVGTRNGTDPVVTYTRTASPPLAIPDNSPRGVFNQIMVTDDFEIADLDFRIDSLTHTFTGDLSIMLQSPEGLGTDLISLIGGLTDGGSGDNMVNMVIDDDLPVTAANDMVQVQPSAAPYTRSWLPVFNAPWPGPAGFGTADATGSLSRYDGHSTQGMWTVHVSDQAAGDTGSLNSWSILVTPVHFDIAVANAINDIAATKTVSGLFQVGGTVTYTVTLTNNGNTAQADNPGNEFTDVLPAGLTLTSATSTTGTATTAGNTASWNGSLAPLGGSVTITITATVNTGTQLQTISNQGTVSYDSDGDGTNDATRLTDDPAVVGTTDPTSFVVAGTTLTGTMSANAGPFAVGGNVTYTVVLSNGGSSATPDNAGDEFVNVLPASLTLVSASATSGTAMANVGGNTVTWNGGIPAGGTVTLTIVASINASAAGTTVSNQGTYYYDADLNGSNEASGLTDDTSVVGNDSPTVISVAAEPSNPGGTTALPVPLGGKAWLALLAALLGLVVVTQRRQRATR